MSGHEIDVGLLIHKYVIKRRTEFYDRAVALGIIDYGQRCALVQLVVEEVERMRADDAALEAEIERGEHD